MSNVKDLFSQHYAAQFEQILEQFKRVDEYVSKNFSDVEWSVEFNDDSQNPTGPRFVIKTRLFTGDNMSLGDRMLKKNEIVVTPELWEDPVTMTAFINKIYPTFTESITKEVNQWYQQRKAITNHSTPLIRSSSTNPGIVGG